jgi:hypothetical protein
VAPTSSGGDLRRFSTQPHQLYGGLDRHARTRSRGRLDREGAIVLHRQMQAAPEPFLKAMAPEREALVVGVACLCTWSWLAALWAQAGLPCVLGHALSMNALHGGQAKHDTSASHKLAVVRRGGMLPQASGDPANRRATRARLRRRRDRTRTRAARRAHLPNPNRQDHLPASGTKLADNAHRAGVAARVPEPAVPQRLAVDLARLGSSDPRRNALQWHLGNAAQPPDAHTLDRRHTGPGLGQLLRLARRDAIHDIQRCPGGQALGSSCRRGKGANASAGQRDGTAGAQRGQADRQWAGAAAAGLVRRDHPAGQQDRTRWATKHGQGHALTRLAQQLGRAVYAR